MAGEAERYTMVTTFVPLTDQELDAWIEDACRGVTIAGVADHRIRRLVQEVVTVRSLLRQKQRELEEAQRTARSAAVEWERRQRRPDRCRFCGATPYKTFEGHCTKCGEPSK